MIESKTCTKCGETKPLGEFSMHDTYRRKKCRVCVYEASKVAQADYVRQNKEKINARRRKYSAANREKISGYVQKYWADKLDLKREKGRRYQAKFLAADPVAYKEQNRLSYIKQRESLTPGYIGTTLRMPAKKITPELLALKREQLTIHRLGRQLKKAIRENLKNPN